MSTNLLEFALHSRAMPSIILFSEYKLDSIATFTKPTASKHLPTSNSESTRSTSSFIKLVASMIRKTQESDHVMVVKSLQSMDTVFSGIIQRTQ
jgi:hypothetical protein